MAAGAMQQLESTAGFAVGREEWHTHLDWSWKEFFRDPSNWWDNRSSKRSPRQPDFKHKLTKQPLWLDSRDNPSWVHDELIRCGYAADGMAITTDNFSPSLIWACSKNKDLSRGSRIHNELQKRGLAEKHYSDALITMYANCGELEKAKALLDMHNSSSVIPWAALLASYAREGQGQNALDSFEQMQSLDIRPDTRTYLSILKACTSIGAFDKGKQIHNEILRRGLLQHSTVLGGALVDMYAKFGALAQAQSVLEKLPSRNVISWSALISGYAQRGQGQKALQCFEKMQHEGIAPNAVTYVSVVRACAAIGAIDKGKQMHEEILRQGLLKRSSVLGGALVDMYVKLGALPQAQSVLDELPSRNAVSWNALITGYAQKGQGQHALECFEQMQREGILPTAVTYVCILKACAVIGAIDKGKQIHDEILRQGLLKNNMVLGGALVDMYVKCGALPQAHGVLETLPARNVISWSCLIGGYAEDGQGQKALDCYEQMQGEGIFADAMTYAGLLKACAAIGAVDKGKQIHDEMSRQGLLEHSQVLGGALVDMYAKCGALPQARNVLENLPFRNVLSWSALISGYAQKGQGQQALDCFEEMQCEGVTPDAVTYICVLKACTAMRDLNKGKQIHDEVLRQGLLEHSIVLGGALVDMYAKCGALPQAQGVLEKLPSQDAVAWNSLIAGYVQAGQGQQALKCLEQMQHEGILPDIVTLRCLLSWCSQHGLVEKGQELFDNMGALYGLKPDTDCFTCIVDLLGRAGHLVKAVEVIQEMPFSADLAIWRCLLGACRKWGDVNVGSWAFEQAVDLDKCDQSAYILMVHIYTAAGMLEKAKDIEAMRIKNLQPGCGTWTASNNNEV
ncbi:hypothetical protein GOP47_0001058 [Adiantum capillus-veneris]|uniref:Pentatricopeptide repeat-containing protein n=1 Tax=Adiantum capillus-veneris TaxID=13818 RepID=A0A9D4VF23_ADICA|nr:hypothetical protein GOP47_0001058 [Adiantum capillus-veneris]